MLLTIFRILNLVLLGNGLYKSLSTKLPPHLVKSGHFQFLTNCSLLTTLIYLFFATFGFQPNWLYNLSSNLEFNVIFSYWTMALVFPKMVAEGEVDRDLFMDLQVHAFPYLYLIIDSQPSLSIMKSWVLTCLYVFIYWVYFESECGKHVPDGVSGYPYPFLKGKGMVERFGCMAIFAFIACMNWFVLNLRNQLF
ncbi:uncharacterized protein KGF55_000372 [Candida pseudojiufengensis]|uniref:uncharacterized protein n=1 Tax=Candida pseudojiufengensis TaxID=497109 RepID=UPI002224E46E|nr:uncharacterized protein KGF55_000372 [Candida pseudojiufengensis]KAI5966963.1 hypothetical protein KGF55_000372 [Candida pseudojiufengensis]